MAGPITLPPGAFAAAKSGKPQPTPEAKPDAAAPAPKPEAKPAPKAEARPPSKPADVSAAAAEKAESGQLTQTEKKIWKLKADGEEFDFDASDEEAIKKEIMKARGADKRFQTAAQLRQEAERFFEMLKDPQSLEKVLADPRIGLDVKKWAQEQVWQEIQRQQREEEWKKNPEAKAQWEREQKLKGYEENEAKEKERKAAETRAADVSRHEVAYNTKIMQALDLGGIPKTPAAVSRMAEYLMTNVENGLDLTAEELVHELRSDYLRDIGELLGAADGDQLLAFLGEANAKKLREVEMKRLRSSQSNPFPARSGRKPAEVKADPKAKRVTGSQWKEDLQKEFLSRKK